MCMLTYYPAEIQPNTEALLNGAKQNDDGHGYAIVVPATDKSKARLIIRHSMDGPTLIDQFAKDRAKYPHGPALFHSRWGTSGIKGTFNCHPFTVGGDGLTIVAHNGVLPGDMQPSKDDKRCDTRMAADQIFSQNYGHLSGRKARKRLGRAIGTYNKLVILTVNPDYGQHSYIINEASGIWETDGIWYSNHDYLGRKSSWVPAAYAYGWDIDDWDDVEPSTPTSDNNDCPLCKSKNSVNMLSEICEMCDSCMDCMEQVRDCLCYWSFSGFSGSATDAREAELYGRTEAEIYSNLLNSGEAD